VKLKHFSADFKICLYHVIQMGGHHDISRK